MSLRRRFELNFGINVGFPLNLRLQWRQIWWKQTFTYVGNENSPNLTATILPEWRANVHTTHPTDAAPQFLQNLNPPYSPPPIQVHDSLFNSSTQFLFFLKLNKSNKPNPLRRNMTSCKLRKTTLKLLWKTYFISVRNMVSCDSDLRQILFQELPEKRVRLQVEWISGGSISKILIFLCRRRISCNP